MPILPQSFRILWRLYKYVNILAPFRSHSICWQNCFPSPGCLNLPQSLRLRSSLPKPFRKFPNLKRNFPNISAVLQLVANQKVGNYSLRLKREFSIQPMVVILRPRRSSPQVSTIETSPPQVARRRPKISNPLAGRLRRPEISNPPARTTMPHGRTTKRRGVWPRRRGWRRMSGDAGFDFLCGCVACASEGSEFQVGTVAGRKIRKFPRSKKSISKTSIEAKIFSFSPPAPRCTFDRSGARRVRIFRTSSLPCDAGFDFFGSERAKGSRKKHQELAADLESREGFEFFAHRPCPATQGSIFAARSARRVRLMCIARRLPIRRGLRFGAPLIEWGWDEYDRSEFNGTDKLERGPRFEAPFQKCVMGTPNSAQKWPEHHRSTSGFGILARVAEGFDVFLHVYSAAPPVTPGTPWNAQAHPGTPWNALKRPGTLLFRTTRHKKLNPPSSGSRFSRNLEYATSTFPLMAVRKFEPSSQNAQKRT